MLPGNMEGKRLSLTDVFEAVGAVKAGTMTEEELSKCEDSACQSCGSCSGMFTANSMNCLTEVLGMDCQETEQFQQYMVSEFVWLKKLE